LSYTGQAPPLTNEEIESVLRENRRARICTHNKDGSIHVMPLGYRYLNGQILMASLIKSRKTRNIQRNNDVTVLIDTENPLRGVLVYGTAQVDYNNICEQTLKIMENNPALIGKPREKLERVAKAYSDTFKSVIVKVTPKHIVSFDYTKDEVWNNFLKTYLLS
jgi:hypothetical protein